MRELALLLAAADAVDDEATVPELPAAELNPPEVPPVLPVPEVPRVLLVTLLLAAAVVTVEERVAVPVALDEDEEAERADEELRLELASDARPLALLVLDRPEPPDETDAAAEERPEELVVAPLAVRPEVPIPLFAPATADDELPELPAADAVEPELPELELVDAAVALDVAEELSVDEEEVPAAETLEEPAVELEMDVELDELLERPAVVLRLAVAPTEPEEPPVLFAEQPAPPNTSKNIKAFDRMTIPSNRGSNLFRSQSRRKRSPRPESFRSPRASRAAGTGGVAVVAGSMEFSILMRSMGLEELCASGGG